MRTERTKVALVRRALPEAIGKSHSHGPWSLQVDRGWHSDDRRVGRRPCTIMAISDRSSVRVALDVNDTDWQ